jgi:hypothetical protein
VNYQKIQFVMDHEQTVTLTLRFSSSGELVKCLMSPDISFLNNFLAFKLERALRSYSKDFNTVFKLFINFIRELYYSHGPFRKMSELMHSCESMRPGPLFDNTSIMYEFR